MKGVYGYGPHTFFYLDPPYYGIKGYRLNFEPSEFEKLARVLDKVTGKFLLSLNDHKEVRRIFKNFQIRPVQLRYSAAPARTDSPSDRRSVLRQELLISNY